MDKSTIQTNFHSAVFNASLKVVVIILSIYSCANIQAKTNEQSEPQLKRDLFSITLEELLEIPVTSASLRSPEKARVSASTTSTVRRQSWQSKNARRISDAVESLPGTQVLPFRFGAEAIALRGFSGSNLPRGVAVRWDGVPLSGFSNGAAVVSVPNINLNTLEKIEVVRGPASALYGSDAFHGVLSLYSVDDTADEVHISTSSDNFYDLSSHFSLSKPQSVRTVFALSANGQGDQQQAYNYTTASSGDQATGYRKNQYDSQTALINISAPDDAPLAFRWGLYWNRFDGDDFIGPGRSHTPGRSALGDQDLSGSNTDLIMSNAVVSADLPTGINVEFGTYIWRTDVMQETKVLRASGRIGANRATIGDMRYGAALTFRQNQSDNNTNWALSLGHDTLKVDEGHTTLLREDNSILAEVDEAFADKERYVNSLVLEAKTSLLQEKLDLVYGGRVDQYDDFGTQKTPRLGIVFTPKLLWTYKLLYGKAFRAPTAFEIYGIGNLKGNNNLEAETVDTIEWAATRYARNWTAGITLFTSYWKGGIIRAPSADPAYRLESRNVDESRSRGLEASWQFHGQRWLTDLSASWVKSENLTQDEAYLAFPRVILNAGLGYHTQGGTQITLTNRVHVDASSGINNDPENAAMLDTYWRVDLSVLKDLTRQTKLHAGIRNLFDRDNFQPSLFNAENGVPAEELSITMGLTYQM
ncbi:MAG: TonB-dependent receptor [Pseudomonadota bacterium]